MILFREALEIIEKVADSRKEALSNEEVKIQDSIGRYLSADVTALENNPRFDNSAMDGFAIVSSRTLNASSSNPSKFKVVGCTAAGEGGVKGINDPTQCIEIMTGAVMPEAPYDAVVRVEDVQVERDEKGDSIEIFVEKPVAKGENVRKIGEDYKSGEIIIKSGVRVEPKHMFLTSFGCRSLIVKRRPKVLVISTGNEVVPFDSDELKPEQIRNSTAPYLIEALKECGVNVSYQGIVDDRKENIEEEFQRAIKLQPDVVITTGGVSAGKFDLVHKIIAQLGQVYFHKVAIRPGKPILFGDLKGGGLGKGPVIFALPGNPVSVVVGFRFFVIPYLKALMGAEKVRYGTAPLSEDIKKPEGLHVFYRGVMEESGVRIVSGQASFMVGSLMGSDVWVLGEEDKSTLKHGELVKWCRI